MRSTIGTAAARLLGHDTHVEIVTKKLRSLARRFEELAEMSLHNAEAATQAALGPGGPPTPEFSRRGTWADRPRLLERSAALGELASAIRCELAVLRSQVYRGIEPIHRQEADTHKRSVCSTGAHP